ncbi:hypothetical protein [Bradyrhizobium sp.]|uniref:hypothetical protein n=1 Tax=Bradyrhizobium sp. TaxID=376 RepID=UPI002610CAE0|nr:hypothetical protein [Bradyrhizobium sp.]
MGKKAEKKEPARVDQVYVLGLDANGKPRGARFPELKDSIASAAMDMNCRVLISQPEAVSALGMKLPVGRVIGTGKVVRLFVPNIRRELYDQISEAARTAEALSKTKTEAAPSEQTAANETKGQVAHSALPDVKCVSPTISGLPRSWDEVSVGHMVLMHESPEDGWFEATVIKREGEVLTLRLRDYPKQGTWVRHINAVALVNPGPA